jgi:hypothetical protein
MASQRQHRFSPNEVPALATGEMRTSLISFCYSAACHYLDEPALMLLKAATLALLNW